MATRFLFPHAATSIGEVAWWWDPRMEQLWRDFRAALDDAGLRATWSAPDRDDHRWDMVGEIEGIPVVAEVKATVGAADFGSIGEPDPTGRYRILVSRRVSSAARVELAQRGIGYYDGQGHLRLWRRPLLVDTHVAPVGAGSGRSPLARFNTPSMLDVALAALDGVRRNRCARRGCPDGAVAGHGLQASRCTPELLPGLGTGSADRSAAAWGAPVALSGHAPPDFYVPDESTLRQARMLLGEADFGRHECTVAVAPAPFVCRNRYDGSGLYDDPFLAPSAVVAALDLAADPARGRETLDLWSRNLLPEVHRVW